MNVMRRREESMERASQSETTEEADAEAKSHITLESSWKSGSAEALIVDTADQPLASKVYTLSDGLALLTGWSMVIVLIFGGCCSNVYTLETIIKEEPDSGLLITFCQFIVTTVCTLSTQIDTTKPRWSWRKPQVPILRWVPSVLMFFVVNVMNNYAFGYEISVPVHIILRSGGSVMTMILGYFWGKRYSRGQVFGVVLLTIGVIVAAMADAQSKGNRSSFIDEQAGASMTSFLTGLSILFVAQAVSALMGLYVQATYARYGPHWRENLFYSHLLSLPLFAPFLPSLGRQFAQLLESPPLGLAIPFRNPFGRATTESIQFGLWANISSKVSPLSGLQYETPEHTLYIPVHLITLALNSLTQYACIRGVNLLGSRSTALGVTVVLNLRKLVSLFASIWLFGNALAPGLALGAAVVFLGAAVYAWAGSKEHHAKPKTKKD